MRRRSKKMECWNGMLEPGVQRCKCFKAARVHDLDLQNNMNYKPTVSIRITTYGLGGASILIDASSRQLVTGHNPRTTTATATYTALHTAHCANRHNTSTATATYNTPHTALHTAHCANRHNTRTATATYTALHTARRNDRHNTSTAHRTDRQGVRTATATYTARNDRHNTSTTTAKFTAPHTDRTHLLQATTSTHSTATRARAHTRTLPHAPQHTARARTHTLPHAQYAPAEQLQRRCQQQQWRCHWSTDFNVHTST